MGSRLGLAAAGVTAIGLLAWAGARGQQTEPLTPQGPPPVTVLAPPAQPATAPPAPAESPPVTMTPPTDSAPVNRIAAPAKAAPPPVAKVEPPPGPPRPVRSPTAILRVLDKITAETLRFEAPIGRRVRYKTLIFTVKACETRGPDTALPRPSAYVVIESQSTVLPDGSLSPTRELFRGWMFANRPGLHPFEHPIYDAWLDVCTDAVLPS